MTKLRSKSGISVVIVVLLIAVIAMAAVIAVPYVRGAGERTALTLDKDQESAAAQAARIFWAEKLSAFTGIYDPDTKRILEVGGEGDTERRHYQIPAYGLAKAHQDMVIFVAVDDGGIDIRTVWTEPGGVTALIAGEQELD